MIDVDLIRKHAFLESGRRALMDEPDDVYQ